MDQQKAALKCGKLEKKMQQCYKANTGNKSILKHCLVIILLDYSTHVLQLHGISSAWHNIIHKHSNLIDFYNNNLI